MASVTSVDSPNRATLIRWVAVTYLGSLAAVVGKAVVSSGPPVNGWQILALALFPILYGFFPIALAAGYLALRRFDVNAAWNGLRVFWVIYMVVLLIRLLSDQPL